MILNPLPFEDAAPPFIVHFDFAFSFACPQLWITRLFLGANITIQSFHFYIPRDHDL
jgi:hypothetical protein